MALQGPRAEAVLAHTIRPDAPSMRFMDVRAARIAGRASAWSRARAIPARTASRSAFAADAAAEARARAAASTRRWRRSGSARATACGSKPGCASTDRISMPTTTPVEAALEWSIPKSRRAGRQPRRRISRAPTSVLAAAGERAAPPARRIAARRAARRCAAGRSFIADDVAQTPIGVVTSGGFGPSSAAPIAMGYVERERCAPGNAAVRRGARRAPAGRGGAASVRSPRLQARLTAPSNASKAAS